MRRWCRFFDSGPGYIDVEEEEEDGKADDGRIEGIGGGVQPIEEEVSVDLRFDEDEIDE